MESDHRPVWERIAEQAETVPDSMIEQARNAPCHVCGVSPAMLRALLADRAVLLAEVRAGRELLGTRGNPRLTDTAQNIPWFEDYGRARAATDARLGGEIDTNPKKETNSDR